MKESIYDSLVVQIEYDGIYGTGVFFQTDEKEYTYLITAAHCIYGDELVEKEIDIAKLHLKRQIAEKMNFVITGISIILGFMTTIRPKAN